MCRRVMTYMLLLMAILLSSCGGNVDRMPKIDGVARVTHLSSSGVNLWLDVNNSTAHRLVVKRGEVDVMIDGRHAVTISLRERVVVPRGCHEVLLPLRFESRTSFALVSLLRRIVSRDGDSIEISYDIRAGIPLFKRGFSEKNIALSEILDNFAISNEDVNMLLQKL